jgi:hypothetical protein
MEEKHPESLFIMLALTIPVISVSVQNESIQISVQNALGNTCH